MTALLWLEATLHVESMHGRKTMSSSPSLESDIAAGAGKLRNLAPAEWILLVLLSAIFAVHAFVPAWRSLNSDFPNYYLGALLHHRGIPIDRIYEWTWFQRQNDRLGVRDGIVGFAPNPPAALLPALPLANWSPLAAKRVWLVLNLLFLLLSWWALREGSSLGWRRLVLISLLCVAPLHSNFLLGQYYVLLLLLLSLAFYAHQSEHRFTAGILLGLAAALKIFPIVFFILLLSRKNWRGVAGMVFGITGLTAVSIATMGMEVHRVFLHEILPQVSRGDWLAPYDLQRNSFVALWSHLFLREPELNPAPLLHAPMLYAIAQGITVVALIFGFLWSLNSNRSVCSNQLEWSALVILTLLLSSTTGTYHPTLLIFAAIVAGDALLQTANQYRALILLLLFLLASAPIPASIAKHSPPVRLIAMAAMYIFLLHEMGEKRRIRRPWVAAAVFAATLLAIVNFRAVDHRNEDYTRRLANPTLGFRSAHPAAFDDGISFTEMLQKRYSAEILTQGRIEDLPGEGDILSLSATPNAPFLYLEQAANQSAILRVPLTSRNVSGEALLSGQEPAVSRNGRWLAFIKEDGAARTAWLTPTDQSGTPRLVMQESYHPLDVNVTDDGDVITSVGPASNPYLLMARRATGIVEALAGVSGPVRYPAISPDEQWVAFSRREAGFWQLVIHNLHDGSEQQLTRGHCEAITPSWISDTSLLYATDCGRGIGLTAIARINLSR